MSSQRKLNLQYLSKLELYVCLLIWISSLVYSAHLVFSLGRQLDMTRNEYYFIDSWFMGYKKDIADFEWDNWVPVIKTLMPWFFLHLVLAEFTRLILIEALPICYMLVTNLILFQFFGPKIVLLGLFNIILYFLALSVRSRQLIWILNTSILLFLSYGIPMIADYLDIGDTAGSSYYYTVVTLAWLQLKCSSFALEFLKSSKSELNFESFLSLLGYSYYLPLYFFGSLMLYDEYERGVKQEFKKWTASRLFAFVFMLLRYIIYIILLDVFLHFFYIHALEYNGLMKVKMFGGWHLFGLGYLLAAFFCMKYIAVYGLMRSITAAEYYNPPPAPSCVFYIYQNSQMWRTFDVGYYQFIKRYIYMPLLDERKSLARKLFAAAVTFSYVFLWHGTSSNVFWWSFLNFIEVSVIDSTLLEISKMPQFQLLVDTYFSEINKIRFTALLLAPLYVFFVIANSFFYVIDGGFVFLLQFLEGDWSSIICSTLISYCYCISAIYVSDVHQKKLLYRKGK